MDNGNLFCVSELGKDFLNILSSFGRLIAMTNGQKRKRKRATVNKSKYIKRPDRKK